jgi:hypothetical protein
VPLADDALRLIHPDADAGDLSPAPELESMPGGAEGPVPDAAAAEQRELLDTEPGRSDLEAAVALVHDGLATRIVLVGFPSWPGLLWHAYRLAEAADVLILPTVVRPGGRVDIVITRESTTNG